MHKRAGEFFELCRSRYYNDITLFSIEVLGVTPTEQQEMAFDKITNGKKKLAIKSGHKVLCP